MYWNTFILILNTFLIHGHALIQKTPPVTPHIPLLPTLPSLLNKKLPVLPTPLHLPTLGTGLLPGLMPPSQVNHGAQKTSLPENLAQSPSSVNSVPSQTNTLPVQVAENSSNLADNKISVPFNGMPEISMIKPVSFSTPISVSDQEKSASHSVKETSVDNNLPSGNSQASLATNSVPSNTNSGNSEVSSVNNDSTKPNPDASNPVVPSEESDKKESSVGNSIPKTIPSFSLKSLSVSSPEKQNNDSKMSALNKEVSEPMVSSKGLVKRDNVKNPENNSSSGVDASSDPKQSSSLSTPDKSNNTTSEDSSSASTGLNSDNKSGMSSQNKSDPKSPSDSVVLLQLPNNPIYAVPGVDTPTDSSNSSKRAVAGVAGTSNLQQPQTYFDGSSQSYQQQNAGVNYQNAQQPFMNNPPNNFQQQQSYSGSSGQVYPQPAGINSQISSQVYQYPPMNSPQNSQIDVSANMPLPGVQFPGVNQPFASVPSNDTLILSLPIPQGAASAVSTLLDTNQAITSPILSNNQNQNEIQQPVPCTCGVFLTGQFKRGSSAQPKGNPVVLNELSQPFPCNSAGKSQCTNRCLDLMVKHLPNSGSIICGSIDHDIRREKAYLWVKNCKDVWVNTNLSSGKEHCCRDGQPVKCSSA